MNADQILRIREMDARIEEALKRDPPVDPEHEVVRYAPPAAREKLPPLPSYVEHREGLDTVGKAASQAIVMQYEGAVKALEAMGAELIDCVRQSQAMAEEAIACVKFVTETCDAYRDESKAIFARIQHASALTIEVRKMCEAMRGKIADEKLERQHPGHSDSAQNEIPPDQQAGLSHAMVRG
jgi:hypothetical protein